MISWIQNTLQKHFKWLFLALLVVIIISFVFVTNTSSGLGQPGERRQPPRPFFGLDLAQAEDVRQLSEDAQLSIYLRFNPQREIPQAQLSQYALNRQAALALAEQLGLPVPSEPELIAHIQTLRAFADPSTGAFDPKLYSDFTDRIRTNPQMTEGDVSRVIASDTRVAAFEKLLAGPGFVLPSDVVEILAQRDTTWTLAIASIDGAAFAPRIDTSDTALQTWFESNVRRYEISPRVAVAAIQIAATNFTDSVSISEEQLRAAYNANPARYPAPDAKPEIMLDAAGGEADSDANFAAVRALVDADLRKQLTERAALKAAEDLAVEFAEKSMKPDAVAAFVATRDDLTLTEIGPVGSGSIPAALGGTNRSSQVLAETVRLSADRPFSNPVSTPVGAALLVWRETIPSRSPELAEVRAQALADYQAAEKRRLFNEAGRALQASVANATASGIAFAEAVTSAANAAGLKAEIKTPTPFSLSGQFPQDMDFTALQSLQTLSKGKVSDFLTSDETSGILVYAIDQQVPAADPTSPAYTELRTQLASNFGQTNAQTLISAAVEAELAKSAPAIE